MEWLSQYWLELLFFVFDVVTALILFFKTRDIKYLRNLKRDDKQVSDIQTPTDSEGKKPEVYLSVSKLKSILSDLENDNGSK